MSLMFCHNAGNYTFTIYDNFCGSIPLLVIALFECIGVAYFYGLQRFCEDIQLMTGSRPGRVADGIFGNGKVAKHPEKLWISLRRNIDHEK